MDVKKEKEKLLGFGRTHKNLYIYGAGNYGRGYLDVLETNGIPVDGFIVSEKREGEFCGKGVYRAEEIDSKGYGNLGIIPAYANSRSEEIQKKFTKTLPDVLDMDHRIMVCLDNEIRFCPIMDRLDQEFGTSPQWEPNTILENILIIRLDAIGDTVMTTPFIRELRGNNPGSHISVVLREQNRSLLEGCPYIDELFLYDSGLIDGELAEQCRLYDVLREKIAEFAAGNFAGKQFDAVFLPRELLCGRNRVDELLLAYMSGAKYKIGRIMGNEADKRHIWKRMSRSFSLVCLQGKPMHEAEYALDLLQECGYKIHDKRMELWPGERGRAYAGAVFRGLREPEGGIVIALGIVASVGTRTWQAGNYKSLIEKFYGLYHTRVKFILLGGNDAVGAAKEICGGTGPGAGTRLPKALPEGILMDFTGKLSLDGTAAIMEQCDLYVGSNTGLLHFASAFGKPSVTIYSELDDGLPTDGDSPFRMGAWQTPRIDLVPHAGLDGCHGVCRMGRPHCINLITPDMVWNAIEEIMGLKK